MGSNAVACRPLSHQLVVLATDAAAPQCADARCGSRSGGLCVDQNGPEVLDRPGHLGGVEALEGESVGAVADPAQQALDGGERFQVKMLSGCWVRQQGQVQVVRIAVPKQVPQIPPSGQWPRNFPADRPR